MLQIYMCAKSCKTAAPWESSSVVSAVVPVARMMIPGMTVEFQHIGPKTAKAREPNVTVVVRGTLRALPGL